MTFSPVDFKELSAFATKLSQPSDAVSIYLHDRLSSETRQALTNYYQPSGADRATPLVSLTNDLNNIVRGPSIFATGRFTNVVLRTKTQRLIAENPKCERLALLNRLLLEDAYPAEISKSDLDELLWMLQNFRPFIEQFSHTTNLVSFFDMVNWQLGHAKREKNAQTEALIKALPALERIMRQAMACLGRPGVPGRQRAGATGEPLRGPRLDPRTGDCGVDR